MAILPDLRRTTFEPGAPIDNPYRPFRAGQVQSFAGSRLDPGSGRTISERNDEQVLFATKQIAGIEATVVRDTAWEDGRLVEDTLDWYAQDTQGHVWYLGELSYAFDYAEDGSFLEADSEGSWQAGVKGALPGHVMPAEPGFGAAFYSELARGVAEDEAIVVATRGEITIGLGRFEDVLTTLETTALEPEVAEFKHYAPGVGLVRADEDLDEAGVPGLVVELVGARWIDAPPDRPERGGTGRGGHKAGKGAASEIEVTYEGGDGELDSAVGAYTYDLASGRIGEGLILFASTADLVPGATARVEVRGGQGVGLFLVADAPATGLDLAPFTAGGLYFRNFLTGDAATIDDLLAPLVTDAPGRRGEPLPIQPLHALGNVGGFNHLNPVAGVHAVERAPGLLGFEETLATAPGHDGDLDDVLLSVRAPTPAGAAALDGLLQEDAAGHPAG